MKEGHHDDLMAAVEDLRRQQMVRDRAPVGWGSLLENSAELIRHFTRRRKRNLHDPVNGPEV